MIIINIIIIIIRNKN